MKQRILLIMTLSVLLMQACSKHDEIEFSGTLVDIRSCSSIAIGADRNPAHIVALDSPAGIGGEYNGLENVVVLYEPTKHIRVDEHIHGTFYIDNDYSTANCDWHNTDYNLPEGVFVKVVVD